MPISATARDATILEISLPREDADRLRDRASDLGMTPAEWISTLVRAHAHRCPPWTADDLGGMRDAALGIQQIIGLHASDSSLRRENDLSRVVEMFFARVMEAADRQRAYWGIAG